MLMIGGEFDLSAGVLVTSAGLLNGVFVWLLAGSAVVLPEGSHAFIAMLQKIPGLGVVVMVIGLLLTGIVQGHPRCNSDLFKRSILQIVIEQAGP